MGWNDHLDDDELSNLPPEAFENTFNVDGPFEPADHWLENADEEDQLIAMRAWFHQRYCDPAHETPYNGREGGYIFVNGGPYDPAHVLNDRFDGIVEQETIQTVIDEMYAEVGDQWAPIEYGPPNDYEYDSRFDILLDGRESPLAKLRDRLQKGQAVLSLEGDQTAKDMAQQLVFSAVISAFEAFLWETVDYWVSEDEQVLRNIVQKLPHFKERTISLGEIFTTVKGLKTEVRGYLQHVVWHRADQVSPLLKFGFEITPPSFKQLQDHIIKRHHIVHRSGQDNEMNPVSVLVSDVDSVRHAVEKFAKELNELLAKRAHPPGEMDGSTSDEF
ncbi:MAG: hypothetical protein EKK46_14075 [Rhodocyclaceae bacterium]|nr:MAG: hypothetical protein EKK46_14075 [Rhodocyclaceae bacterium]